MASREAVDMPALTELADTLATLPPNDLVEVLRRVFETHPPEPLGHVERRYFLAVSNHAAGTWEVTGIGYPLVGLMENNDLQQGNCPRCALEVEAPAKQAQCPACLAPCGLT